MNMAFTRLSELFLLVHNRFPPEDAMWRAYLDEVRRLPSQAGMRTLVLTEGGGPGATQRMELNAALEVPKTRVAVVSSSVMVQGIMAALGLFNSEIRSFSPSRLKDAYAHLGLDTGAQLRVRVAAAELCGKVGTSFVSMLTAAGSDDKGPR